MSEPAPTSDSRAEELYQDLLARQDDGESVDVDALCAMHPQLASELRQLHDTYRRLRLLLPGPLEPETPPDPLLGRLHASGTRDARYREEGEVARGGMGVVLRVWDEELERRLAMKVVRRRGDGVHTLRRFLTEARITSQLDHPGIVPVHEIGLRADGAVYYTMRLVEGDDLRVVFDKVKRGVDGWTLARAVNVLLQVCEAMRFAHERKVVHRDLKPANIMVGRFGEVYVMDWGLARVLDRPDVHDVRLRAPTTAGGDAPPLVTCDGVAVGTPYYMSPEQARGDVERLGPHSDVYAVGAMLYQLLSGRLPYQEEEERERPSSSTVLERVLAGPPRELGRAGPAELVAVCERAMAREVGQRYATMQALAQDLRAFTEGRVVAAYETGGWAETRKWVRRNPGFAGALVAVLLATLLGAWLAVAWASASAEARAAQDYAEKHIEWVSEQDLRRLVADADSLWPASPAQVPAYESWIAEVRGLLEGRGQTGGPIQVRRLGLVELRRKLDALRRTALPLSEEDRRRDRESHPRREELERMRNDLLWRKRMLSLESWPSKAKAAFQIRLWGLSSDPEALRAFVDPLVRPGGPHDELELELRAIATEALSGLPEDKLIDGHLTLGWAQWRCGDLGAARAEIDHVRRDCEVRGIELPPDLALLERHIAAWQGDKERAARRREADELATAITSLERELDRRRTFRFATTESQWWHDHLSALVADLTALTESGSVLSNAIAEPFGWGVQRRLEFARTIQERSCDGPEARAKWQEASAAVLNSGKYGRLELVPQLGLLPIGTDPVSGLQEFAHLQTGEPAERGDDRRIKVHDGMGLVFVLIPAGLFEMGAREEDTQAGRDERPRHKARLSAFFLSKYEMTQSQWRRIAGSDPSYFDPRDVLHSAAPFPVENVSWDDCQTQLRRLGLILPSEAQWEYACRARTDTVWWTGDDRESLRGNVNLADETAARAGFLWQGLSEWPDFKDGYIASAPIGAFAANGFGLHEVVGNVAEWCQDDHGNHVPFLETDPIHTAQQPVRVQRGGSFLSGPSQARSSYRTGATPNSRNSAVGLRPARRLELSR